MKKTQKHILKKVKHYHFELKHLIILLVILIFFQVAVSFIYKISLQSFLDETQEWYQQDFAERIANLTATSLEMLLETTMENPNLDKTDPRKTVQAINIILSQQLLQHYVEDVCLILTSGDSLITIDDGQALYAYFFENNRQKIYGDNTHQEAINQYSQIKEQILANEQIFSLIENRNTFHVFVPFVPKGEFIGVFYMKNIPEFGFITKEITASYNQTSMIFIAFILLGLLAMFFISSQTVQERDETQKLLYEERERKLKEYINLQKEALFAKRIYHTHHKAEKVMGFIKEDLSALTESNAEEIKYKVTKYANFISRVIYDMKWYDPPVQTIRNPIFRTNLNELIEFIVNNIFLRVSNISNNYEFKLDLDKNLPIIHVNEFVIWEIIEPLIQNAIDHSDDKKIIICISTKYFNDLKKSEIKIADNDGGISQELLDEDENGIQKIFLENITTKQESQKPSGYGCYIAFEIATQRCGWMLDVRNLEGDGCEFTITIPHN
ncbi:histidine kinase [candidate division KSB1 bacterium]|nr:histidine kinase [candidate division KSB1 bacterium]